MAVCTIAGMTSCSETSLKEDQNIAYKIENKETLTDEDYSVMIDYVGAYAEKAQKYVDMQINGTDLSEAAAGMQELNHEYPLLNTFRNCIRFTPAADMTPENLEKVQKYAGYIEFSAPAGFTIQTAGPDDAGDQVEAPQEENGVVAGAVDEVKVENRDAW